MPEKLRLGIVGYGSVAQQAHIPVFLKLKDVVLQAACDKNESLAKETVAKYRGTRAYTEFFEKVWNLVMGK